jgi:hypothetical protein
MNEPAYVELTLGNWIPSSYKSLIQLFEFNPVKGVYSGQTDKWYMYFPNGINDDEKRQYIQPLLKEASDLGFEIFLSYHYESSWEDIPAADARESIRKIIK